jgi:5-dehydro-4-deoxyglucarate dehydratase
MVKAGAKLVGKSAGSVRPPLVDLTPEEEQRLQELITAVGPQ